MALTPQTIFTSGLYRHSRIVLDSEKHIYFLLPEIAAFEDRDDTITHVAQGWETVLDLAVQYYKRKHSSPIDLWPAIADFQPYAIEYPLAPLRRGLEVLIPSYDFIREVFHGESLADNPLL